MPIYYDDNYGVWENMDEPDGPSNREFYKQVQKDSVWKKCKSCDRKVKIRRSYSICNSCADKIERGWQE